MSRKSAIQPADPNLIFRAMPLRAALQIGKRLMLRRGAATHARADAFFEMGAAVERQKRFTRNQRFAAAMGREMNPDIQPTNVNHYVERHRDAVAEQTRIHRACR